MGEEKQDQANEAWQEVGQQFQALGKSLAAAFKASWGSEETRQYLSEIQSNFETAADQLNQAAQELISSEEAEKIKVEVKKAAQSAETAGRQTFEEVRPHILAAFRQIRNEVDQIIGEIERQHKEATKPEPDRTATDEAASDSEESVDPDETASDEDIAS